MKLHKSMFVSSASGLLGLAERVLEVFIVFWLCFIAWRLFALSSSKPLISS